MRYTRNTTPTTGGTWSTCSTTACGPTSRTRRSPPTSGRSIRRAPTARTRTASGSRTGCGSPDRAQPLGNRHRDLELPDPLLPFGGASVVHRAPGRVDRDGDRHVLHLELVDRLHPEVMEREDTRFPDRLR